MSTLTAYVMEDAGATIALSRLLDDLRVYIRRYVVVSDDQAIAISLWASHTHAIEAAECTPYLQITSATKRAGKTRLLEVLEPIVRRPWLTGRMSAAVLIRKVDAEGPTLLLDESDATFNGDKEYAEALRGILNTGYRKSGKASLCVGHSTNIQYRDFSTFCPKAIAGIGALPGTIADRAIRIELRRRKDDEPCARWRERDGHAAAAPIGTRLAVWAKSAIDHLRDARPDLPAAASINDRQADIWEPLLAIADLAAGDWPRSARQAAIALAGNADDTDIVVELLKDISAIIQSCDDAVISTKELLEKLIELEDRPWATWRKEDKPITGRGLARLLDPLGIHPAPYLRTARGYRVDSFTDVIARYLPLQVSMCHKPNKDGAEPAISMCHTNGACDTYETQKTPINTGVVTHGHIDRGETRLWLDKEDDADRF